MVEKDSQQDVAPLRSPPAASKSATLDGELVELVRRALSGNQRARDELCERQLPLFQRVAAKLTYRFRHVTRETARQEEFDILQYIVCAFLEELRNQDGVIARWRPEQGPLEAWLRPFATCRGLDSLRKRKGGRQLSFDSMAATIASDLEELHALRSPSGPDVEHNDALRKLCALILEDPSLGQEALTLLQRVFWEEEDREVLARSLGMKRNTLDVKIKRTRESLLKLAQGLGLPFVAAPKKPKLVEAKDASKDGPKE